MKPNLFAESVMQALFTPGKALALAGIMVSFSFFSGAMQARILINQTQFQQNDASLQADLDELSKAVGVMNVEVKKTTAVMNVYHPQ